MLFFENSFTNKYSLSNAQLKSAALDSPDYIDHHLNIEINPSFRITVKVSFDKKHPYIIALVLKLFELSHTGC